MQDLALAVLTACGPANALMAVDAARAPGFVKTAPYTLSVEEA
jgi:hypothetical protein